ncbi:MAG: hypothetical protein A4E38_00306 [Methanoregulaceae archaeon PtaB.Bin108]|nr:MAG: hypothetical protein A4E38_00306 [Methanoregulaceae archaeon PtaB.Bin108]
MSIEELEHTADIRMRVSAPTLEELFSEAARALMIVMYGCPGVGGKSMNVSAQGHDIESLMHAFLSELLFLSEVEGMVFSGAEVIVGGNAVEGTVKGEPFSPEVHSGGQGVKGISFSGFSIVHEQGSYILDVIFDV